MSMFYDIIDTLSSKKIKAKLSQRDRAELLHALVQDLQWCTFHDAGSFESRDEDAELGQALQWIKNKDIHDKEKRYNK